VLLDPSLCCSPNSPWCQDLRTRKAFAKMCRAWRDAGMATLYMHVAIRRATQIFSLMRTTESHPYLGNSIMMLLILYFVLRRLKPRYQESLDRLLESCNYLSALHFIDPLEHCTPYSSTLQPADFPFTTYSLAETLTHLECRALVEFSKLNLLLKHPSA